MSLYRYMLIVHCHFHHRTEIMCAKKRILLFLLKFVTPSFCSFCCLGSQSYRISRLCSEMTKFHAKICEKHNDRDLAYAIFYKSNR